MRRRDVVDREVRTWTVGQTADLLGVTVRALHHYDTLGLVAPSARTSAGYRLYDEADLARLETVVVHRRLGFSLDEVRGLLAGADPEVMLRRRREAVRRELDELHDVLEALDTALERQMNDRPITAAEMRELFGDDHDEQRREAEERWGDTDPWRESARRTATYTQPDWEEVKAETEALHQAFLRPFRAGLPADSPDAMDAAELHRQQIDRRFYSCGPQLHRGLGDLYVSDPRYAATYDESLDAPGLSVYVRDAIHANADRLDTRD
jgi:DNA-binding transcriptional MerR regulator